MTERTPTRTVIGGIPAYSLPQPPGLPFFVGLMVRAGWGDETLKGCGLTHLVEHLALPGRHVPELELNGTVLDSTTLFWFSGNRDDVLEHLVETTRALTSLPLDRLESERSILFTEQEQRSTALVPLLKSLRFGTRGYGLSYYEEYALRWAEADDVAAWAARFFTRGNACLYAVGELPPDLDVGLPEGEPVPPARPEPIDYIRYPSVFRAGPPATVGVSFVCERSVPLLTALRILDVRLRDTLRHRHGVTYSSDWLYEPLTVDEAHVVVWADAMESNVDRVRNVFLTVLDELAFAGPTEEELESDRKRVRERLADPLESPSAVHKHAEDELLRDEPKTEAEFVAELEALSPRDIAAALTTATERMLLCLPREAAAVAGRFTEYPLEPQTHVSGRRWKRRRGLLQRRLEGPERELVTSPEGVTLIADGFTSTVRYDECTGMLSLADGTRALWSADGFYVAVNPEIWRDGPRITQELDAAVPAELRIPYDAPDADDDLAAGDAAYEEGRWNDAVEAYRRGLERRPDNALAWTALAFALEAEGRTQEELAAAERAVETGPRLAPAQRALARALRHLGRRSEAVEAIRTALQLDPSDVAVLSDYAWLVGDEGDADEAVRAATRAVELYPDDASAWFALASAAEAQGDTVREEEALRKCVELEPAVAIWHNNLGWFLLRRRRDRDALDCFERALKLEPGLAYAGWNRAYALGLLGKQAEAERALATLRAGSLDVADEDLRRDPEDVDALQRRATALLALDRRDDARAAAAELEERARAAGRADRLFDAAALRLDLGEAETARRLFEDAFAASEDTPEACYYRAFVGAHLGEPALARDGAERMSRLHGRHPYADEAAGYAAYAEGDLEAAGAAFARALERQPLRCCAHAWRGVVGAELGTAVAAESAGTARILCVRGGVNCASLARLDERLRAPA